MYTCEGEHLNIHDRPQCLDGESSVVDDLVDTERRYDDQISFLLQRVEDRDWCALQNIERQFLILVIDLDASGVKIVDKCAAIG